MFFLCFLAHVPSDNNEKLKKNAMYKKYRNLIQIKSFVLKSQNINEFGN